jgi:signal transduction histidine kinase
MRRRGVREARETAMDAVAASIAHEVNQPLGAVVSNSEAALLWLKKKPPDIGEVQRALEDVVNAGHRASDVIGSVRTMFAKNLRGRVRLPLNNIVQDVLAMVDGDLRTHRISVSTELREGLPQLLVDRGQLQQVFLNLMTNAIEAMSFVADRSRRLAIKSDFVPESSGIVVTIEDTGTGIHPKDKDRIFESFYTTKGTGTGMGLTICRSIIESHGGSLEASANSPHGTIFRVTLPGAASE